MGAGKARNDFMCKTGIGEQRHVSPSLLASLAKVVSLWFNERPYLKAPEQRAVEEDTQHMHMNGHGVLHKCIIHYTLAHTQ